MDLDRVREFDPRAAMYSNTHREINRRMDISLAATVVIVVELDAQKEKDE